MFTGTLRITLIASKKTAKQSVPRANLDQILASSKTADISPKACGKTLELPVLRERQIASAFGRPGDTLQLEII